MYLKQLEIIGFKSFAEKTKLNFEPGITAVVGPNGCGKTNIVDSIKWAVGEQSAKSLRSGRMEDVIFHGTDERKGISMAEVSLTFDNSDKRLPLEFSEVTVTRRVFRSGESQYFLNKNLCRLKDIDDIFMDTGVGMKAYSVFEQGRMDLILSSKPEDRRFIFEEAAGISKYKERKKETLHKLENTENNLVRLNDIIKEVQRQINAIERQAAKARRYKKIQDELKAQEIKSYACQLSELKNKCLEFERDKTVTEKEAARMREAINEKEARHTGLRQAVRQIDSEISGLQDEKLHTEKKLIQDRQDIQYKKDKINDLSERNKKIENEIEKIKNEIAVLNNSMLELCKEAEKICADKINCRGLLNEKTNILKALEKDCGDIDNGINEKKGLLVGKTSRESNIKNELSAVVLELKSLFLKTKKDSTELNRKNRQMEEILNELAKLEKVLLSQKEVLLNVRQWIKDHEEKVFLLRDEVSFLCKTLNDRQQYFTEKRSEYEILSNQKRTFEGYADGVKTVFESRNDYPGVIGLLSDIITVPREYVTAISAVLGQRTQWVVADTMQNALNAALKLKDRGVSRTVFLVLELLPETSLIEVSDSGIRAADIVAYDKKYEKLVRYLLGRVCIVPEIKGTEPFFEAVLATKDGVVADPCGIVASGMTMGKNPDVLIRDTSINELKILLNNLSEEILGLNEKYRSRQERLAQEERHLEISRNSLYNEEISLGIQESDYMRRKASFDSINEEMRVLEMSEREGAGTKDELENARLEKEKELEAVSLEIKSLYGEIESKAEEIKAAQAKEEKEEKEHIQLKISLVGIEEKENLVEYKRQETQRRIDTSAAVIAKVSEEQAENIKMMQGLESEISGLEKEIEKLSVIERESAGKIETIKQKRKEIEAELTEGEEKLRKERESADSIFTQLNERQLRLSEMNLKIDNIMQKLQDDFKMTPENIDAVPLEGIVMDVLDQEIVTLKDKLASMGEVSLMAIEEQDELVKRHEFLSTQRDDLVNAKDSLLKAIAKINTTTKKLFWDTFCQIRENFNAVFCQLFGGGKADLVLLDESDILESGIDIIARPPGKKLQNVSLLSGGEKALTAIALLFSMFKVKPSPFCIMDEIDAPLDDSNIERFTELLKEFARTSQFIIVTHNKSTISAAQSLYGITMQESGVSRVVSVRFSPSKDTPQRQEVKV